MKIVPLIISRSSSFTDFVDITGGPLTSKFISDIVISCIFHPRRAYAE